MTLCIIMLSRNALFGEGSGGDSSKIHKGPGLNYPMNPLHAHMYLSIVGVGNHAGNQQLLLLYTMEQRQLYI